MVADTMVEQTNPVAAAESNATVVVDAELGVPSLMAQIVRFDIPQPTSTMHAIEDRYHLNMCLTPRPLSSRGGYAKRWGPHRLERLGDIFLLPPGESLFVKGGSGRQASLICHLDPDLVHGLAGQVLEWDDQHLATTLDIGSARIRAILFRVTEEVRHPGLGWERMLEFLAGELALELARHCLEAAERPITGGLSGWRLRLIDERLSDEHSGHDGRAPTLQELAALCNLSVRQLTRGFRVSRACSIGDYIEQRRMESAKRLLMAGESVKSIAFAMGFASPSSFTFAFRRAVGASPSTFRQRQGRAVS
ncbi:AraC family transcriptional regulator [Novosphingobium sp. 9U]|uniref:helix-turn-helix transcriptional regulator n=1 Tax=Novosphingobium sp. 9U TaxID=2653158 RepID=UPI001F4001A6|nr:AraC family transcriptional regulator [Novosphingobium sp. 9U]